MPRASQMPWSGFAPDLDGALGLRLDDRPQPPRQACAVTAVEQDRVQHRAEDVVLPLVEGAVSDPHRPRAGVAGELVAGRLGQVAAAVDAVHDLERAVLGRLDVGDELHELVGLPVEIEPVQGLQREGRVAHPGVAVVPVALTAGGLGQRRRERRHRRPGRHVRQALDGQHRALDRIAEPVVGDARSPQPGAPEPRGRGDPRRGVVDVRRSRRAPRPTRARSNARSPASSTCRARTRLALDPEREVGPQADRLAGAGRVGCVPPRRRRASTPPASRP